MNWLQVPPAFQRPNRVPLAVPWLVAVLPLRGALETFVYGDRAWAAVAVVTGVLAVAMRWLPPLLPLHLVAVTVAYGVVTDAQLSWHLTLVVAVPLGFWAVATNAVDPPYRWLPSGRLFRPCLVPLAWAAGSMLVQEQLWTAQRLVVAAVAMAVVVVLAPAPVNRGLTVLERWAKPVTSRLAAAQTVLSTLGRHLGRALGAIALLPAAGLLLIAWGAQRLVGFDPLAGPRGAGSQWVRRAGEDPEPHRMFSGVQALTPSGFGWSLRRGAAAFLTAGGVAVLVASLVLGPAQLLTSVDEGLDGRLPLVDAPCSTGPDPAMEQDPGWPDVLCDTSDFAVNGRFSAVTTYSIADFESDTVNVTDGIRQTWRAPACDCRRVRMWLLGGSAAFGWWQSDDVTIASQLARTAWERGIALDIDVYANPGWVLGQEHRLFTELSATREPPDVAVFYDGGNELQRQRFRNEAGRGADESPTSYAEDDIDRLLRQGPFPWNPEELNERGSAPKSGQLPPAQTAEHAMNRYLKDLKLARRSADAVGVEPVFVWQPLLVTAGRAAGNPGALPDQDWALYEAMLDAALPMLPDNVLDMSDSLDDVGHPLFKDLFHHNAEAAGIIADDLFEYLQPQLRALSES